MKLTRKEPRNVTEAETGTETGGGTEVVTEETEAEVEVVVTETGVDENPEKIG